MPVDFPNSPTVGDEFTTPSGAVYTWDGVKWVSGPCGTAAGGGTPAPPNMAVQWNNNDVFGGSANLIWNDTSARLGIATSTPEVKLDVLGNTLLRGESGAGAPSTGSGLFVGYRASFGRASIYPYNFDTGVYTDLFVESANLYLNFNSSGPVRVATGTLSLGPIPAGMQSGDLSVAEPNSPQQASGKIFFGNTGANVAFNGTAWVFTPALPGGGGGFWQGGSAGAIYYNGGPVGIGTATPLSVLDVVKASSGLTPADGTQLFVENAGHQSYVETACANASDSCGYIFSSGASLTSYIIDISDNLNFVTSGPRSILLYTNSSERMRITSAGNVGIGTTNPTHPLEIHNGAIAVYADSDATTSALSSQIQIFGASDTAKFLSIGFDTSVNEGSIQAGIVGASWNVLALNPIAAAVTVNGASPTQNFTVAGNIGCSGFAAFGGDQTSQVNGSAWYGIGPPNNLGSGMQVAGYNGIQFCTAAQPSGAQLYLSANGNVGIGTRSPRTYVTFIPRSNPTTWSDFQFCIGEVSDNGGYGMYLGYQVGGDGAGRIQAIANSGGSVLYLNPQGGDIQMPASNVYISNHTCFAAAMQANNFNGGDFSGGRVTCNNWVIINGGGVQFPDGSQQGTAAVSSSYNGPTNFVGHSQGDRPLNTQFVNSTGRPMWVSVETSGGSYAINAYVAGNMVVQQSVNGSGTCFFCVLPGQAYQVNAPTWQGWWEWY